MHTGIRIKAVAVEACLISVLWRSGIARRCQGNLGVVQPHQAGSVGRVQSQSAESYIYIYIYNTIYNRKEQCALPVTTIMALWQLVNLGTRCTVTHCRIALWSHQSAQTASSERCIMQIVNVSLRDSPPNP